MRFLVHGEKNKAVRVFAMVLSVCILCALFTVPSAVSFAQTQEELVDIKAHWAEAVIRKWVNQGLAKGYGDGRFGPNDSITRAEFVTLLNRIFGYQQTSEKSFPDVKAGAWYAAEIAKAYQAGIIGGDNNGNMNPEAVISRQEAAVILARAFSLAGDNLDAALKYSDVGQIAEWALGSVGTMTKKGYVTGRPGNLFAPKANLSRCEAVKMIDNVMGELINAGGTYTRVVPGNMVISSPGVTLKDTYIAGDLYLTGGIGTDTIKLIGVAVKGKTIIAGGIESISLTDTLLEQDVLALNEEGKVTITAEGLTEVGTVTVCRNVVLSEQDLTGLGFKNIQIAGTVNGKEIVLKGDYDEITVEVPQANVTLETGAVGNFVVDDEAVGTRLTAKDGTVIESLNLYAEADITGGKNIKHAVIASGGVKMDQKPKQVTNAEGGQTIAYHSNQRNTHSQPTPKPTDKTVATPKPTSKPRPTAEPTQKPTPTPTQGPTAAPTPTQSPTAAPTPTQGPTATPTQSPTTTPTPTPTQGPTTTPTPTPATPTPTPSAQNFYYVRQGASGANSGTDWTNAWTDLPESLERGATYYIAVGTYGSHTFQDDESGSEVITIKKATADDHGTDHGWKASFAVGQALFTAEQGPIFRFNSGYYTVNGQTGEGKSKHGIKIYNPSDEEGNGKGSTLSATKVSRYLTFEHIEIEGCDWKQDDTPSTRLLFFTGDVSHLTIRHCYVHDSSCQWAYISKSTDILIEHSYFKDCFRGMGLKIYGASDQMNVVIRYNQFENVYNANNFIQLGEHHCQRSGGYEIYGNVFVMNDPSACCTVAIGNCGDSANDNVFIYNNTFVGLKGCGLSFYNENDTNVAANNLWVDCDRNPSFNNIKDINNSKNVFEPNIFVQPDKDDFRIAIPVKGGTNSGENYSIDPDGRTRGEDGDWDYGAYEYRTDDLSHAFFDYSTVTGSLSGHEPFRVKVDSSGSIVPNGCSIVSCVWNWGDGTTSSGETASHTFDAGQHTLSLTITDNLNRKDTRKLTVNVLPSEHPNLYLYLPLNGECTDASGKGMTTDGELLYGQGIFGKAVRFNQDTSRSLKVSHSNYLDGLENMTIAFWAKKDTAQSSATVLVKHTVYRIELTKTGIKASLWNSQGQSGSVEGKDIVTDTGWHHYTMVYDGTSIMVYIDGVLCGTSQFSGKIVRDSTSPLAIGRNPWGESLEGLMDEIRIYDKALSADEVLALKNAEGLSE
jgi:hypothetical protein